MEKILHLTVEDRYNIVKYAYNLPSTLQTYFPFFRVFLPKFEFSPEEQAELGIRIVDGEATCDFPDKKFDIDISDIPEGIHDAIKMRITDYKDEMHKLREANKANPSYTDPPLFVNMVETLKVFLTEEELAETEPKKAAPQPAPRTPVFRITKR